MRLNKPLPIYLLIGLSVEKFIQHITVSYAFFTDLSGIRETVAVDYGWLLMSGFIVGWLFLINLPFLYRHKPFSFNLLFALALFDIIGEFIAQGTLIIDITLSFVVAIVILLILMVYRKRLVDNQ